MTNRNALFTALFFERGGSRAGLAALPIVKTCFSPEKGLASSRHNLPPNDLTTRRNQTAQEEQGSRQT